MGYSPKWATPHRQAHLVALFLRSQGFCVFGHRPCPNPDHHYELFIEWLIAEWKADDRGQTQAEWKAEQRQIHCLGERGSAKGQFNMVARDIFFGHQPQYYLEGLSISGLTFMPFAKLRLASSFVRLHVDLGDTLRGLSKAKRRKAIRYGKALPSGIQQKIDHLCTRAVRHYLR